MGVSNPILNGLMVRCPGCGKAPMLHNVLAVRETCPECGLSYKFADSGDGPAVFVILILGALALGLALFVEFRFEPPAYVHLLVEGIFIPVVAVWMLRLLKGVLINLQYAHKAEEGRFKK